jgi:hypothetical protein
VFRSKPAMAGRFREGTGGTAGARQDAGGSARVQRASAVEGQESKDQRLSSKAEELRVVDEGREVFARDQKKTREKSASAAIWFLAHISCCYCFAWWSRPLRVSKAPPKLSSQVQGGSLHFNPIQLGFIDYFGLLVRD